MKGTMRSLVCLFFGLLLLCCKDSPTEPPPRDKKLVIDSLGVVVTTDRIDFTIHYYFDGASGVWNAFRMEVGNTVATMFADSTSPYPEHAVQTYAPGFTLLNPLTTGDSVWVKYRFTGVFFSGSDTTGTFDFADSVRTVVW